MHSLRRFLPIPGNRISGFDIDSLSGRYYVEDPEIWVENGLKTAASVCSTKTADGAAVFLFDCSRRRVCDGSAGLICNGEKINI